MINFRELLHLLTEEEESWPPETAPVSASSDTGNSTDHHSSSGTMELSDEEAKLVDFLLNLRSMSPEKDSYSEKGTPKSDQKEISGSAVTMQRNENLFVSENLSVAMSHAIDNLLALWESNGDGDSAHDVNGDDGAMMEEVGEDVHEYRSKL